MRRTAALLAALAAAGACGRSPGVRPGDAVTLGYELSADGAVVESKMAEPVRLVQGAGQVPAGVDAALLGMAPGAEKRVELTAAEAFGPRDPARVQAVPLKPFGALAAGLKPGRKVRGFRDGKPEEAVVVSVSSGSVTLDFNHPLAGKAVSYRLRVVAVGAAR